MADRCFHGSPIENCADCLIERLTHERDAARHDAAQAHGVAQALERQVLSQQETCAKASIAVVELARERDENARELAEATGVLSRTIAERDEARQDLAGIRALSVDRLQETHRLRALLRDIEREAGQCPLCGEILVLRCPHAPDCRLKVALENAKEESHD